MYPTLEQDDRLLVEKISTHTQNYKRGDIVILNSHRGDKEAGISKYWVKRVIAISGDTIECKNSKVYVNDEKQDSKFLNNTRIELTDTKLENGDELEISQVGSSNTIFRTSQTYVYQDGKLMKKEDWEAWKAEQEAQEADGAQPETDQAAEPSVSEQQP